jgi:uncharacterized protein
MSRTLIKSALPAALAVTLAVTLAACSTTPTHYYTLLPSAEPAALPAQDPLLQFEIASVDVPPQVDIPQIVVRLGGGAVAPVETRRWIGPLASEIRLALGAALSAQLNAPDVSGVAADPTLPLYRVQLRVRRFDSALGASAQIEAAWTIRDVHDAQRAVTCESKASVTVAPGYEALAGGHQRALVEIATGIGKALLAVKAGRITSACAEAAP